MPRDLPDWHALSGQATVHEVTDLGELAVRLDSIVTFDRRGDVFFMDDFEDELVRWKTAVTGSGASVAASTAKAKSGAKSALLTPGTADGNEALIQTFTAIPSVSRLGMEFAFLKPGSVKRLDWSFYVRSGSDSMRASIRYDDVTDELLYRDTATGFTAFATGVDLFVSDWAWHVMKLVVDPVDREYIRLILDDSEYDLTGKIGGTTSSPVDGTCFAEFRTLRVGGGDSIIYVDDAILTQNEPV